MTTVDDTTPYAWPYGDDLAFDRLALVVCGTDQRSLSATPSDATAEANIDRLCRAADDHGVPTYFVRHTPVQHDRVRRHRTDDRPPGSSSTHPVGSGREHTIDSVGIDGFYGSALDAVLRADGRDQLLLAGFGLETTVHSTLRTANDAGYECLTVVDACGVIDETCRSGAISSIEMSGGIFGAVGVTDSVLAALGHLTNRSDQT